ncbi:MAG TPA: hypothetical protein VGK38_11790 [Prolixibacteraceae bacterium]
MKNFFNFLFSVTTAGFLLLVFAFALGFGTFVESAMVQRRLVRWFTILGGSN